MVGSNKQRTFTQSAVAVFSMCSAIVGYDTLSLKHTGPTVGCLKRLGRLGRAQEQIYSVCSAAFEALRTARTVSAPIQHAKSKKVGSWLSEPLASLIGGVLVNQGSVWEGRNSMCALFFCHFLFWRCGMRLVPPAVKEAYCISRKCRTCTLLWSWQHVEAVCSMQLFC